MEKHDFRPGGCLSWVQKQSSGTLTAFVLVGCTITWVSVIGFFIV